MKKLIAKKWFPHVVAVLFFLMITIVYFSPVVFDGKDLVQGDVSSVQGWGKDLKDYHEETGDDAFWSNAMFSGMPANYAYMPPTANVFKYLAKVFSLNLPSYHMAIVFLYMLGFYVFLIALGCRPWLSMVGAIAYAFASYNFIIIEAGHVNKGLAMATMAPVLGGIILTYRKNYIWGILTTLIFTGIHIFYGHQQVSYYLLLIIAIMAIVYLVYAIKAHALKDYFTSSIVLLIVAVLAILPAAGYLLPTMDYTKESMRGGAVLHNAPGGQKESTGLDIDYAFQWSYGVGETMTLLVPNFYGGSSYYDLGTESETYNVLKSSGQGAQFVKYAPTYWGDQPFTSGPVYAGAVVCFLFVLGLFVLKGPEKWWLVIATVLSVMLSWGRNFAVFNDFLFYHLPLYNKFRTPSMALVIAGVAMAAMAVLTLKTIIVERDKNKKGFWEKYQQPFFISLGITGGLCLLLALFGGMFFDFAAAGDARYPEWLVAALQEDRQSMLTGDAWRSLAFIVLGAAFIWLYLKNKLKVHYLLLVLGALILFDMWSVDKRFLNNDNFVPKRQAKAILPTPADELILQDKDPNYRVLNLAGNTFQESTTSYFHKSIGGYSPAKLRRYQDIIDYHFSNGINIDVLNMLNARYFILSSEQGAPTVQRNPEALGNCWLVDTLQWVSGPDEEIAALNDFNPATTAVIDNSWKDKLPPDFVPQNTPDETAKIEMTMYTPGAITYESASAQPQMAVFSEVFYKTWKAYVDGAEWPLIRVNYILRGLALPAGTHKIEFKCVDDVFLRSAKISLWSSVLVGLLLIALVVFLFTNPFRKTKAIEQ